MAVSGKTKCDVLILSADFGAGHHQVSHALRTALEQRRPAWNVEIYNFFNLVDPFFRQFLKFSYYQVIKHFSYGYEWFYKATQDVEPDSRWQQLLNKMGQQKLLETIQELSPRVIICTFPTPAGVVSMLKGRGDIDIPTVTVITDVAVHSQWIHPHVDAYIVAAETVANSLSQRGIPRERIHVTGIPLRPQFETPTVDPDIWKRYSLDPTLTTLMVMGGGNGLMPGLEDICQDIGDFSLPLQVIALTGSNKSLAKKLDSIAKSSRVPIHVLGYIDNIAPLMKVSHLLLTKAGGVTIFEALATGLPMLLYKPLPGHEMCNAEFLINHGTAVMAEDEKTATSYIKKFLERPWILEEMAHATKSISKPFATREAVKVIIQVVEDYKGMDALTREVNGHLYA